MVCLLLGALAPTAALGEKTRFGYLEKILVFPGSFPMEAKLDTGADHSSVHAHITKRQKKAGNDWITFEIANRTGAKAVFDAPVHRVAKVRRHSGKLQERPVVYMEICLGTIRRKVEVNLVDRKNLSYKMLIGRSFLANYGLVDSSAQFTSTPNCR